MKEGLRALRLQRAMQMSYIDTWRKPVNVPKSPQIGGGGKMPSPRSQATLYDRVRHRRLSPHVQS